MSVLIKGMDMPPGCYYGNTRCLFNEGTRCMLSKREPLPQKFDCKPWDCPLAEIPTPHGRLIDADIVSEKIGIAEKCEDCKFWNGQCERGTDYYVCDIIYDSPTILEAED